VRATGRGNAVGLTSVEAIFSSRNVVLIDSFCMTFYNAMYRRSLLFSRFNEFYISVQGLRRTMIFVTVSL